MAKRTTQSDNEQNITLATINQKLIHMEALQHQQLTQSILTNGRVKSLEIWRAYLIGGVTVIIVLMGWLINAIYH